MSGLFEKKVGRDERREARVKREMREKRKTKVTAIIVVLVLGLLFVGSLFLNSGFIRQTLPAVTIDGHGFSAVEFDYFYRTAFFEYQEMLNSFGGGDLEGMLPSFEMPHSSQIYNSETGETWADFFRDLTMRNLSGLVAAYNDARRNGFVLPDDRREMINQEIMSHRQMFEDSGDYPSFEAFLRAMYETSMNERTLRGILEFVHTSSAFHGHMYDSFTYTGEQLAEFYNEGRDMYDVFTYRILPVYTEEDDLMDFDDDAAQEAALGEARNRATAIAAGIVEEEDFINAARELDPDEFESYNSTLREQSGEALDFSYESWLKDNSRAYGDIETFDFANGVNIIFYVSRNDNSYSMVEMRQLLVLREELSQEDFLDDIEAYDEAVAEAGRQARQRAEEVLELFVVGGATEERMIELMEEHSDDWTEGGLYTDVSRGMMVSEINDWLFDPVRQVGDFELIHTEAYGYHLVYFSGFGGPYNEFLADGRMRENDYQQWTDSLGEPEAVRRWAFFLTSH